MSLGDDVTLSTRLKALRERATMSPNDAEKLTMALHSHLPEIVAALEVADLEILNADPEPPSEGFEAFAKKCVAALEAYREAKR
jgi:hypothetical protein